MMSVHDALRAWQAGDISASRAMALTGAENVLELYAFAASSGVEIEGPNPHELATAKAASDAIRARVTGAASEADDAAVRGMPGGIGYSARIVPSAFWPLPPLGGGDAARERPHRTGAVEG